MLSAAVGDVSNDGLAGVELAGGRMTSLGRGMTRLGGLVSLFHHRLYPAAINRRKQYASARCVARYVPMKLRRNGIGRASTTFTISTTYATTHMTFTAKALNIKGSNAALSLAHVRVVSVHDAAAITTGPAIPSHTARAAPSPGPNIDALTPAEIATAMTHQSAFIARRYGCGRRTAMINA